VTKVALVFFTICVEPVHISLFFSRDKCTLSLFACLFKTSFGHHTLKRVFIVVLNYLIHFILAHIVLVTNSA
jgi:hypothetical protein